MNREFSALILAAACSGAFAAPVWSQATAGYNDFQKTSVSLSRDVECRLDAAKVESLRDILMTSTNGNMGSLQEQAIQSLVAIYGKPSTTEELKTTIVKVVLTDAVASHSLDMETPVKEISAAEALYDASSVDMKEVIIARLEKILTYDEDQCSNQAAAVLSRIIKK